MEWKGVFVFPAAFSHYILIIRDTGFLGHICDIFLSCLFVYPCICLFVLLQWTRSIIWHLQPLLPTTCTIPLRHSRPILLALLTCLVSQCSRSCGVQIGMSMKKMSKFQTLVCFKVWPSVWVPDFCWPLPQRFTEVRNQSSPNRLWECFFFFLSSYPHWIFLAVTLEKMSSWWLCLKCLIDFFGVETWWLVVCHYVWRHFCTFESPCNLAPMHYVLEPWSETCLAFESSFHC